MIHQLNKFLSFSALAVLFSLNASGQTEFLGKVNPATGVFTKIDSLSGVKWISTAPNYTTFDENGNRFIFRGGDNNGNWYLYSVDAATGDIVSNPPFPVTSDINDNIAELQYDNASDNLYGLHWDHSENREYFVSINATTGAFTKIDSLPGVTYVVVSPHCTTFDEINHRYIFRGLSISNDYLLYSVDATTGTIVSSPVFPNVTDPADDVMELQFDNSSGNLYGLFWDDSQDRIYVGTVNPSNGVFTSIDSIPGVKGVDALTHYTVFDETNHRYIFKGRDANGDWFLYAVDVTSGTVVSSPAFPVLADPADNVVELQFDNSSGNLYGLHWDAHTIQSVFINDLNPASFDIYPNPFSSVSKILLDKVYSEIKISVFNSAGQILRTETKFSTASIDLHRDGLPNGIYFVSLVCDRKNMGIRKVVLE